MPLRQWIEHSAVLPGAPGSRRVAVTEAEWLEVAQDVAAAGGRWLALWGAPAGDGRPAFVRAAYLTNGYILVAELEIRRDGEPHYPGIESIFPAASRRQRAMADLLGLRSSDPDRRGWLKHEPEYEFVRVQGDGVHEIPVGPVHAGIIEPGHFRFSVVGEKVLKLEERLGYVHKGIERRFTEMLLLEGHRLAARVSGDSAVAYSWAYCQALEGMAGVQPPARAIWLRGLLLELERIANHLGDLGALGNDVGFAFGLAQFSRLKEILIRQVQKCFGRRYLMDTIVPGGVAVDLPGGNVGELRQTIASIGREVVTLREIYDEHAGVRDRFMNTGRLPPALAVRLGTIGLGGRASGQALDLRVDLPCAPYDTLTPTKVTRSEGDVAARAAVRFEEVGESCRLVESILDRLPSGPHRVEVRTPPAGALGAGAIEGWRGPVFVALEAGVEGSIRHCHPHDPSWQNWPALEHAIMDNIVPDFPLLNKSFNLSYSGHDL